MLRRKAPPKHRASPHLTPTAAVLPRFGLRSLAGHTRMPGPPSVGGASGPRAGGGRRAGTEPAARNRSAQLFVPASSTEARGAARMAVAGRSGLELLARLGYAARGAVSLLVGFLALLAASGGGGGA